MLSRAHTLARLTAMLLVALWGAQPLGLALHVEQHAHRFCPQHQTFEEDARRANPALSRFSERAPVVASVPPAVADATALNHETCPLLTAAPQVEALQGSGVASASACVESNHPATAPPRSFAPLAVLDTAPKASPPTHA
ncbi:hypothetical protein HJC10_07365 [Corallococcus exiguus]|uniref:Uncharacterized protein n=1 Tax=Corallococcus exiguus TaxID=83462 RepID=A0A7X4YHL1_9BACT|nr:MULTISPECIES: hypothetical protein [Corallococcus]NBC45534.1 hypothetical protein [Corallococcus exiguus]NNC02669.1 hypothetical protein [Corallococcus exiguus]NNC17540.1 hypothetical protein [Corallococcus exiguus]NPC47894.1 hypothetical protein [Corallococcus exiguus]NRD56601.1 hypothetical protein [Corallococcus exiguus]